MQNIKNAVFIGNITNCGTQRHEKRRYLLPTPKDCFCNVLIKYKSGGVADLS